MSTTIKILFGILPLTMLSPVECAQQACRPNATEVFHLRAECAAIGDKLVAGLIQERKDRGLDPKYHIEGLSHYSPADNHCYVKTTSCFAVDGSGLFDHKLWNNVYVVTVYDGQTREELVQTYSSDDGKRFTSFVTKVPESKEDWWWNQALRTGDYDYMCRSKASQTDRDHCLTFALAQDLINRIMKDE